MFLELRPLRLCPTSAQIRAYRFEWTGPPHQSFSNLREPQADRCLGNYYDYYYYYYVYYYYYYYYHYDYYDY